MTRAPSEQPADSVERRPGTSRFRQLVTPVDLVDVFVYVVVLNLAIEYIPSVISETFTISLLTAVLLKVVLELVIVVKERVLGRLRGASTRAGKVVGGVSLWLVAVGSKFVCSSWSTWSSAARCTLAASSRSPD